VEWKQCAFDVRPDRNEPTNTKPYWLPAPQKSEGEKQVERLLKEGITEESNSPWNSPILVVAKRRMLVANKTSHW
jgi:hypothetical protein